MQTSDVVAAFLVTLCIVVDLICVLGWIDATKALFREGWRNIFDWIEFTLKAGVVFASFTYAGYLFICAALHRAL